MNRKSIITAATVVCFASLLSSFNASAQDIEFMGKNGDKIELTPQVEALPNNQNVAPQNNAPQNIERDRVPNRKPRMMGGLPNLNGRTFTVVGPDGETKEISTENARSVTINRSFSSVTNNGEQQIKQGGTAIIVDADGQRYEIDLSQIDPDEEGGEVQGKAVQGKQVEVKKSYMIGVFSEPVPEMLRSQLDLDEGVGLMVKGVQDDSPAALAGIKKFDVLLYADDQVLTGVKDLTDVVTETGADEQAFTLTLMRGGKEIPVEVTAVEREATAGMMQGFMPMEGFEMRDMGPGLILDRDFDDGMMERMRDHMNQVREQMKRMDGILEDQQMPPMPQIR